MKNVTYEVVLHFIDNAVERFKEVDGTKLMIEVEGDFIIVTILTKLEREDATRKSTVIYPSYRIVRVEVLEAEYKG